MQCSGNSIGGAPILQINNPHHLTEQTVAHVLLGGRRTGYQDDMPGLMQEALFALEAGQPLYLAGGFGGVTVDILRALGVDDGAWLPPMDEHATAQDPGLRLGYRMLQAFAVRAGGPGLDNGLTPEENRQLAATHRPGDIAALVSLGVGRLQRTRKSREAPQS